MPASVRSDGQKVEKLTEGTPPGGVADCCVVSTNSLGVKRKMPGPFLTIKGSHSLKELIRMPVGYTFDLAAGVSPCTSACREVSEPGSPLCHLWAVTGAGCLMIILQRVCD